RERVVAQGIVERRFEGQLRHVYLHESRRPAANPNHAAVELAPHDDHSLRVLGNIRRNRYVGLRAKARTLKLRWLQATGRPGGTVRKEVDGRQRIPTAIQEILLVEGRVLVCP